MDWKKWPGKGASIITPLLLKNFLFPRVLFVVMTIVLLSSLTKSFYSLFSSFMGWSFPPTSTEPLLCHGGIWDSKFHERIIFLPSLGILQHVPVEEFILISVLPVLGLGFGICEQPVLLSQQGWDTNPSQSPLPAFTASSPPNSFLQTKKKPHQSTLIILGIHF